MLNVIQEDKSKRLQSEFYDPNSMAIRARQVIRKNRKTMEHVEYSSSKDTKYESVNMEYPENIQIEIDGVYENGIVYDITCYPDEAAGKYDTYTKAKLVCINDQEPIMIINGYLEENNDIQKALGSRIDGLLSDTKDNIFNRKTREKKRILIREKIDLFVEKSLEALDKLEETKEEQKEEQKGKK